MCLPEGVKLFPRDLVDELMMDLKDRSGFDHLFDSLDPEILWEMRNDWMKIAEAYAPALQGNV
jgi:hypothetical protein